MTKTSQRLLPEQWSAIAAMVKRVDEDRWLSSRYATKDDRRTLITLYAFNHEMARIRLVASEPALGAIRFQWWRDILGAIDEGRPVAEHDIAMALAEEAGKGAIRIPVLLSLLDRHEKAFEAKDRSIEPEAILLGIAIQILASKHGWGQSIRKIAPAYAAARRGETRAFGPEVSKVPSAIRPAAAHLALRYTYAKGGTPGGLIKRIQVLRAMLTGKV